MVFPLDTEHASLLLSHWWQAFLASLADYAQGWLRIAGSLSLIAVALLLSHVNQLGLGAEIVDSITRAFVQLSLIGFVLAFVFQHGSQGDPLGIVLILAVFLEMVVVAGITVASRGGRPTHSSRLIAMAAIFIGCSTSLAILLLLQVFPPTPRYVIPVAGMMVGNSMSVTGVTLKRLREGMASDINRIETALSLGATPSQALTPFIRSSLSTALSPILDQTKTMGIISLPGAMTGMIMGGASPFEAAHLQIIVMNMLIGASSLSSLLAVFMTWPTFFTSAYQVKRAAIGLAQ